MSKNEIPKKVFEKKIINFTTREEKFWGMFSRISFHSVVQNLGLSSKI